METTSHSYSSIENKYFTNSDTYESSSSSLVRKRNKKDKFQGEYKKIKAPTFEGGMDFSDKYEEWLLEMKKYFKVHEYTIKVKYYLAIYHLNGKVT